MQNVYNYLPAYGYCQASVPRMDLMVIMCCDKCEEKVKEEIQEVDGKLTACSRNPCSQSANKFGIQYLERHKEGVQSSMREMRQISIYHFSQVQVDFMQYQADHDLVVLQLFLFFNHLFFLVVHDKFH